MSGNGQKGLAYLVTHTIRQRVEAASADLAEQVARTALESNPLLHEPALAGPGYVEPLEG